MKLASFDVGVSGDRTLGFFKDLAFEHLRLAGLTACHPASTEAISTISQYIANNQWKELCSYEVPYDKDLGINTVLHVRQALAFFQKLEFLDLGVDKEEVARRAFYSSELDCLWTNSLLNKYSVGRYDSASNTVLSFAPHVERVLKIAQRKIEDVLGTVPSISSLEFLFGPGATTSVPKRNACAREKLSAVPSCSLNMLPIAPRILEEMPHYLGIHADTTLSSDGDYVDVETTCPIEIHQGRLAFVPKNAKTYRTTMTEPTLNALAQSAFGRVITKRLLRVGQDTTDQTRNQKLAQEGSISGALATLDLSGASDSISYELVALLLPYEWFAALALCRTPSLKDQGKEIFLQKFSSMGNGFTFPLQTLIFWALCSACVQVRMSSETRVSVYGDDIIVGCDTVPLVREVFSILGFKLNKDKSYWSGPFRESCGKDYYFGIDVRPFYAKTELTGEVLFLLHNFYYRRYQFDLAEKVKDHIDPSLRIYGPDGYGDGHLLSEEWVGRKIHRDRGYAGSVFDTYTWKPRYHFNVMPGDGVLPTYSAYERSFAPEDEGPRSQTMHRKSRVKNPDGISSTSIGESEWFPVVPIPGVSGLKRISIYTLIPR